MQKSFYLVIAVLVAFVLFVGSAAYYKNKTEGNKPLPTLELTSGDHVRGSSSEGKTVVLMEYADFQCPACGQYYPLVEEVLKEVGNKVTYVYRHMPLNQHANAYPAALASEAAANQGKFWEMHQLLFTHQADWEGASDAYTIFASYAKSLNLDMAKFQQDYTDKTIRANIADSYKAGVKLGVVATPTFFLNGTKLDNPRSKEEFISAINAAYDSMQGQSTGTSTAR